MPRRKVAVHITDDRAALLPGSIWWAYVRVSLGEKQDIASQRRAVQEFADKHGLVIARWWADDHVSGSSVEGRDAFDGMVDACRKAPGQCAGILVWNLARWARNDLESQYYRADLRLHGYAVVSVSDDIPSGDLGLIMEALLDFKNRKYLEDLSKDTKRGLRDAVLREVDLDGQKRSGFSGGGFPPRGYRALRVVTGHRKNGEPRVNALWEIDPVWQERVARARRMYAEGVPVKAIHDACGLFRALNSYTTFWPNLTYAGVRRCGDVPPVLDAHPTYDDPVQRAKIEARFASERHRATVKRTKVAHLLCGLAFCGYCGAPMHGHAHPKGDHYNCAQSHRANSPCKARRVLCRVLDNAVLDWLRANVWTPDGIAALLEAVNEGRAGGQSEYKREAARIEKEQGRLARQIENLVSALADGAPRSVLSRIKELESQQAATEARLRRLALEASDAAPLVLTNTEVKGALDELAEIFEGGEQEQAWRYVRSWIGRVEVFEDRAGIAPVFASQLYRFAQYPQRGANVTGSVAFGKRYKRRA